MDEEKQHYLKINNISSLINRDKELKKLNEELEKLKKELKAKTEKCRQYERDMVNISVMDRWNIGKFLHDNLSQKLVYAKILVSLLKDKLLHYEIDVNSELNEIMWVIENGAREIRSLSHDVIPKGIEEEGILPAIKQLENQTRTRHGVNCILETDDVIHKIKRLEVATELYHITQEAIKNAVVHGKAKNIKIALIEHNYQLYLHIKDDGKGLGSTDVKSGMGITIMKHRAKEIGGTVRIRKAKDADSYKTIVTCTLPLNALGEDE